MEGRYTALERSLRREEARIAAATNLIWRSQDSPPPPRLRSGPPPSSSSLRPKKRSTYGLQRDYRVLEREKKVSNVLEDLPFRSELERILQGQLEGKNRPKPTRPSADQWLEDLSSKALRQPVAVASGQGETVIPINDLRGITASKYTLAERGTRCKLAAVYRLVDMFGWSQLIYNHITARSPGSDEGYLVNAFGLMYREVTASNLVCVDLEGNIIDPGSTQLGVNRAGLVLHSAIHKARRDIKCAIHIHNTATVVISAVNCGLLPISTDASVIGNVSYTNYLEVEREGVENEIASTLGTSKALVVHNHGVVAIGESIEEAFSIAHKLVKACEIQVAAMSAGLANINQAPCGVWSERKGYLPAEAKCTWKVGELEFEALMRMLDNKGYETGYMYKGLELLQPAKARQTRQEPEATSQQESSTVPNKTQVERLEPVLNIKKPAPETGKEPWEFLEEEREIQVPARMQRTKTRASSNLHASLRNREVDDSRSSYTQDTSDSSDTEDDRLHTLQVTVKQVAKSTGVAVQKITQQSKELSLLETAELIARSTGNNLKKLGSNQVESMSPKPSVKCVARATSVGGLLRQENVSEDALEMVQQTAEQVARSTGDAVNKLLTDSEVLDPLELTQLTAKRVAKSTGDAAKRVAMQDQNQNNSGHSDREEKREMGLSNSLLPPKPLQDTTVYSSHIIARNLDRQAVAQLQSRANRRHQSPDFMSAVPISKQADDVFWKKPNSLSNGYHLPLRTQDFEQARSDDSDSEYSTTESVEFVSAPANKRVFSSTDLPRAKKPTSHLDLETNPMKNMAHTAEMVAESTGKAVHKLTTTLH